MARTNFSTAKPDPTPGYSVTLDRITRRFIWLVLADFRAGAPIVAHGWATTREAARKRAAKVAGPRGLELSARVARRRRRDAIGDRRHACYRLAPHWTQRRPARPARQAVAA